MNRVSIIAAFLLASTSAIGNVSNDKLFLRCSTPKQTSIGLDIQLFEENKGRATLVLGDKKQSGVVLATKFFYHISFTATKTGYRSLMYINRYTGYFEWEIGEDPFWASNSENTFHSGACEVANRKF